MSSTSTTSPIITVDTKSNPHYQNHVGSLARTDANHDLGIVPQNIWNVADNNVSIAFKSGLPNVTQGLEQVPLAGLTDYHETGSLASVILKINEIEITAPFTKATKSVEFKKELSKITEVNPDITKTATPPDPTICQIGYRAGAEETPNPVFTYNAVKFSIKKPSSGNPSFPQNFFFNTNLGGATMSGPAGVPQNIEAAVIVDFAQCKFFELLASGTAAKTYTLHYLMTPEMVNDPAGKPSINNASLFNQPSNGITMKSYIQINTENMSYSSFNSNDPSTTNNFFSKLNFGLLPIKQIITAKKLSDRLISTLIVSLEEKGKKPLVDPIDDSKSENCITVVMGYLRTIMAKLSSNNAETKRIAQFNFNSKCQQKRSGDWLQALCCQEARNREYVEILPATGRPKFKLNQNCPVYFVTHDQIAAAYALLNGINVIYFSSTKEIFVFKNNADSTVKGSGKSVAEIYLIALRERFKDTYELDSFLAFARTYTTARKNILTDEETTFTDITTDPVTNIPKLPELGNVADNREDDLFRKSVQKKFVEMFTNAVRLMFVTVNLTDITEAIENINNQRSVLNAEYPIGTVDAPQEQTSKENLDAKIISLNKSVDLITYVLNRFGTVAPASADKLQPSIVAWINANVTKIDVFKAAQKIDLYGAIQETNDISIIDRLTTFGNPPETRTTDKHIFLPFIQTLDYKKRQQIVSVLRSLTRPLQVFLTNHTDVVKPPDTTFSSFVSAIRTKASTVVSSTKSMRVTGDLKFYNNSANLILESMILLDTEPPPLPDTITSTTSTAHVPVPDEDIITKGDILELFSTDDEMVKEDFTEILALLNGKNSNVTSDEPESTTSTPAGGKKNKEQTGGNILEYYDNVGKTSGNTISDVSITGITYPIMGDILVTALIKKYVPAPATATTNEEAEDTTTTYQHDIKKNDTASALQKQFFESEEGKNALAAKDDRTMVGGDPKEFLLEDYNMGYHPLLPIYMLLSPFYYTLDSKYDSYPYFDTYFTYFNILNKMVTVLKDNYLHDQTNKEQITDGYLIGFGLGHMLFTSNSSLALTNAILSSIGMDQSEYYNFSLKNDSLASLITGSIHLNTLEEQHGIDLLTDDTFKNFINEEVNLKQMLGEEIPNEGLTYVILKNNVLELLKTIVAKITNDRNPNSWEKAKLRKPVVQGISSSQLSTISMNTGRTNTPDTLTSSSSTPISVGTGGFLKTKKQKRKSKRNLKTKRQKNKRSNKKSKKNHRRRKQRKQTRKH